MARMTDSKPHSTPFSVPLARELTTFKGQAGLEQALTWRLNEACDEIERLEEQVQTLESELAQWRNSIATEALCDENERLKEQLEACEADRNSLSKSADYLQEQLETAQEKFAAARNALIFIADDTDPNHYSRLQGIACDALVVLDSNPAISPSECDGTRYCVAETHIHGCFAERAPATEPNEEEDDGLDPLRLDDVDGADPATGISDAELLRRVEKHTEPSPASRYYGHDWPASNQDKNPTNTEDAA